MQKLNKLLFVSLLILSLAVVVTNCGGGGGGGDDTGGGTTTITSSSEGAQSAAVGANTAQGLTQGTLALSGIADTTAPQISVSGGNSKLGNALTKLAKRVVPTVKKARALKAPVDVSSFYCTDGGSATEDIVNTTYTLTFTDCADSYEITNGVMSFTCNDINCDSLSMTLGSGGNPYVITGYTDLTYTTPWFEERNENTLDLTFTEGPNYPDDFTFDMTGNGYFEIEFFNSNTPADPSIKDRFEMTGLSITEYYSFNSVTMEFVYDITANGDALYTYSENSGSGYSVVFSEQDTYTNLRVVWKELFADYTYTFSIDGTISVSLTPPDTCFDGTFSFVTNQDVTYNYLTGVYESGQITVNGNTVIVYNADGSVTVTVDGASATYTSADFDAFCPDLGIEETGMY